MTMPSTAPAARAGKLMARSIKNFDDLKVGDQLEVYEVVEIARTL